MRSSILLALLTGCDRLPPKAIIGVCEATGADPAAECTTDMLVSYLRLRAPELELLPRSVFIVITTGKGYGDAIVTTIGTVPDTFGDDPEAGKAQWLSDAESVIRGIQIPDDSNDPKKIKSDVLGAISRASAEAENYVGYDHELLVASDGLFTSIGIKLETDPVTPEGVVQAVKTSHLPWDLSGFSGIALCGWHGVGLTPDMVARRRDVWTALIDEGQGPSPNIRTNCKTLISSVRP